MLISPERPKLSRWSTAAMLVLIHALTIISARAELHEHVLKNLSSGPPADPLPPLRSNKPSAAEMAAKPRQHPYLYFNAQSRQVLRDRAAVEPCKTLAERLEKHANDCLGRQLPPPATINDDIPQLLADGSLNPAYLREFDRNQFGLQGYLMAEVIPTLGLAYQMTGRPQYAEAGRKWLVSLASWRKFATKGKEADFDAGHYSYALALGYDWLWEVLDESERGQVLDAFQRLAGPMVEQANRYLARANPQSARGYMEGNHPRRTHGLFAMVPLAALYELPAAQQWLDVEIQYQRDRLYPSAYAPNGEHADAWDHIKTSLDDPTPFAVALHRMGGEDLFNDPQLVDRFRGLPRFYLYGLEQRHDHRWYCTTWFALASRLKDPLAQWIALGGRALQNVDEVTALFFHDPDIPMKPPEDPPGSVYFPYSGLVKMCTGWRPQDVLIPFRCGPEVPKDQGDQNGFRLCASGEWLLPRLRQAERKSNDPAEVTWDLGFWYHGSPAQNVIVTNPEQVGDHATYEKTGRIPMQGGLQFQETPTMKGREYGKQWLSGPEIPKRGELRVVSFDDTLDYVCGEAHRAYAYSPPALWLRHVLFVKGDSISRTPYVLVCDELEAGDQPQVFAWQLQPLNPFTRHGQGLSIEGRNAGLTVHFLAPADGVILEKQAPAPLAEQRTRFVQVRTPRPQSRCVYLTAMIPRRSGIGTDGLSFRVVEATGGWAVEVHDKGHVDLALFRSDLAKTVETAQQERRGPRLCCAEAQTWTAISMSSVNNLVWADRWLDRLPRGSTAA